MTISKLADVTNTTANQIKTAHLATFGPQWWPQHELLDELYTEAAEDYDRVAESARHHGEPLGNSNNSAANILGEPLPDLPPIDGLSACEYARSAVIEFIIALEDTANEYPKDLGVQNMIGDLHERWTKNADFKLKQTGATE
jgi:hypothetical protein